MTLYTLTLNYTNAENEEKTISLTGVFWFEILYFGRNKCVIRRYSTTAPEALENHQNNIIFDAIDLSDFTTQCTNVSITWGINGNESVIFTADTVELITGSCSINYDTENNSVYYGYDYIEKLEIR